MRKKTVAALAALCFGASLIAACNQQTQQAEATAPAAATPVALVGGPDGMPAAGDLSPEANSKFLADYAAKEGVMKEPSGSGLMYRVLKSGTGATPMSGNDLVTVTYKGALIDGTEFDATPPGENIEFQAGGLIPGWVIALSMMKEGDQWELVIPSELGYGATGTPGGPIPPNQTLVFVMELQKVTSAAAAPAQ
jgi:FKBP-type peptidyl-prolyl cis-trans isomerase